MPRPTIRNPRRYRPKPRAGAGRGDAGAARKAAAAALDLDHDQLLARWVQAELARMAGDLDAANAVCKWFIDYYNAHDVTDPESLGWIGLGAAQYARWNRLSGQFSFLVNELYPDALKADPAWWPAHYAAGLLYLEKYNEPEAARELKAALAINPRAAEVHAALARLAAQNFDVGGARLRSIARWRLIPPSKKRCSFAAIFCSRTSRPRRPCRSSRKRSACIRPPRQPLVGWPPRTPRSTDLPTRSRRLACRA